MVQRNSRIGPPAPTVPHTLVVDERVGRSCDGAGLWNERSHTRTSLMVSIADSQRSLSVGYSLNSLVGLLIVPRANHGRNIGQGDGRKDENDGAYDEQLNESKAFASPDGNDLRISSRASEQGMNVHDQHDETEGDVQQKDADIE